MNWKFWFGIGVSAVIIFFLFKGVDYQRLLEASKNAHISYWLIAVLIQYLLMLIRAFRWQFLMEPVKEIGIYSLFSATTIGFMANNILPARMGEFVRAYVIGEREGISKASSFATIVVERLFDGLSVLLFAIGIFLFLELPAGVEERRAAVRAAGFIVTAVYTMTVVFLYLLIRHKEKAFSIVRGFLRPFPERFKEESILLIGSFAAGLDVLKNGRSLFMILLYSILHWFLYAVSIYIIIISFGFNLPLTSALLIMVFLTFAVALPSSPGFIGPFHAAIYIGLGFYGINKEEALGMAIVMHLANFTPIVLLGAILLWKEKLAFSKIRSAASSSV